MVRLACFFRNAATLKGHITTVHSKLKADDMQTAKLRLDVGKRRRKVRIEFVF